VCGHVWSYSEIASACRARFHYVEFYENIIQYSTMNYGNQYKLMVELVKKLIN
jgi:hypothetical protein